MPKNEMSELDSLALLPEIRANVREAFKSGAAHVRHAFEVVRLTEDALKGIPHGDREEFISVKVGVALTTYKRWRGFWNIRIGLPKSANVDDLSSFEDIKKLSPPKSPKPNASTAVDASEQSSGEGTCPAPPASRVMSGDPSGLVDAAGSGGGVVVTPPTTPAAGDVPETNFGNMVGQDCPHGGQHDFSDGEACRHCSEPMPSTPMGRIAGKWPGDETEEHVEAGLKKLRKPTEFEQLKSDFLAAPLVAQVAMAAWVVEVWQRENA